MERKRYLNKLKTIFLALLIGWLCLVGQVPAYALTLTEAQKLLASDRELGDGFGRSISISEDTALISAFIDDDNGSNSGSAYVLIRDNSGTWSEQQKLIASDGTEFDFFGWSVSISGDTAMIGAPQNESKGLNSGTVYVFVRDNSRRWEETQKLTASDGAKFDNFGTSVSISGDTVLIGSWDDDDNGESSGSAYVFVRDATGTWREQ